MDTAQHTVRRNTTHLKMANHLDIGHASVRQSGSVSQNDGALIRLLASIAALIVSPILARLIFAPRRIVRAR